ncbi:PepSY domain-containing protein [Nocardia carnea]|uniref:PepSY domain-containing protein n=1 Tax=Nocardia carnea TaxID=37328 RepID=UPI002458D191|nr:PepSY domain-containing protein [Nocardia carnea]
MRTSPRYTWRYVAQSVIAGVLVVASAGCAGSDDDSAGQATTTPPVATTTSPPSAAETPAAPAGAGTDALYRAGNTATGAVPGSTLISIETERDGRWEVQVVTADGTEHEMDISSDGATVTRGPTAKTEDEDDKTEHRDRTQAARLDYRAAADKVLTEVPNGTITELNLDGRNGTTVWEADVLDSSQAKQEVTVDAGSGQILQNTTGR